MEAYIANRKGSLALGVFRSQPTGETYQVRVSVCVCRCACETDEMRACVSYLSVLLIVFTWLQS